jgi:hypothetical protein
MAESVAPSSDSIFGKATLTTDESMNAMLDPRTHAAKTQFCCRLAQGVALSVERMISSSHGLALRVNTWTPLRLDSYPVYRSVEKLMHQRPNLIHFFFQRKMARIEKMELCVGKISFIELSTLDREDSIIFTPGDQHGGLLFTEIRLPFGIGIQIPFCVVEDRELDILVPRPILIRLVDDPIVRADPRRIADAMQIMPLGSFNRQKPVE